MIDLELTLAVVGIGYRNADKTLRAAGLVKCTPGEPVELRLEPKNKNDRNAIAVFSARGIQIGYVTAERAPYIGKMIRAGEECRAVFQELDTTSAAIRVRFGGQAPTLPASRGGNGVVEIAAPRRPRAASGGSDGFYPDPEGPMWGA